MIRKHLLISGDVQGVFFRMNCKREAESLAITGWVKNLSNGKVEVVVQGDERAVIKMIKYCEHGPISARVADIQIEDIASDDKTSKDNSGFEIRY